MSEASKAVNDYLADLSGWQRENLVRFREQVHNIEPSIKEDWKWSVPVFLVGGKLVCAMSTFKDHTKYNFFEGASLSDKHNLFNSGLDSKKHRSINLKETEQIDKVKLDDLIREAIIQARISQ